MSSGEYSRLPMGELERLDPELDPRDRDRLRDRRRDRDRDRDRPIPINLQATIDKDSKRVTVTYNLACHFNYQIFTAISC